MSGVARLWNRSVFAQTSLVLCTALLAAQALTFLAFCSIRADVLREAAKAGFERDLVLIARQIEAQGDAAAGTALGSLGLKDRFFWIACGRPEGIPADAPREVMARLGAEPGGLGPLVGPAHAGTATQAGALRWIRPPEGAAIDLAVHSSDRGYVATLPLASGLVLSGLFVTPAWTDPLLAQNWSALALTAGAMMLASVMLSRRLTSPMRRMAAAATAFGQGREVELAVDGPVEVADAARAFNEMRDRIARFVEDRTHMLSAIGHDLRTPLTSARLRVHLVEDEALRDELLGDLDGVEAICESALSLVRDLRDEPTEAVDLAALVQDVCAGFAAMGRPVTCASAPPASAVLRPVMLRRALSNLIENAVAYGGEASVDVAREEGWFVIRVADRGPGVPEDATEALFEPFHRLEASRSRATGGTGLGLTLARSIARRHGGEATLANRMDGPGAVAELRVPAG